MLAHAARLGAIGTNPVQDAGPVEGTKKDIRALTAVERADLMSKLDADDVAESHDLPDLVAFMMGTGCRIGEVIAAQTDSVDWDADSRPSITQDVYMDKQAGGRQVVNAFDDAMGSMRRGV